MTTITSEMTEEALSLARRVWEDGRPASAPMRRADGGGAAAITRSAVSIIAALGVTVW